ncbi:MAG: methionyl-tRNA formyltransferase [bacterium]
MKLVFFGTPEIAVPSLKCLIEKEDIDVVAVITQPDKPSGRGQKLTKSPVKIVAEENCITVYQPKLIRKDSDLLDILRELKPDIFITVAFGQILSQEVLDIPRLGTINLHASLLPKYRGANPIQWPIINGDKITGVTTMLTDIGVDTGDILLKEDIIITDEMTSEELYYKIAELGPDLLYKTVTGLNKGEITPIKQNNDESTHAPKLKKEDGKIDWAMSVRAIHNKIRGMQPWPSTYCEYKENIIKIIKSEIYEENINNSEVGLIKAIINNGVVVSALEGDILIQQLQPQGKKAMDASSWANGARLQVGDKFN